MRKLVLSFLALISVSAYASGKTGLYQSDWSPISGEISDFGSEVLRFRFSSQDCEKDAQLKVKLLSKDIPNNQALQVKFNEYQEASVKKELKRTGDIAAFDFISAQVNVSEVEFRGFFGKTPGNHIDVKLQVSLSSQSCQENYQVVISPHTKENITSEIWYDNIISGITFIN